MLVPTYLSEEQLVGRELDKVEIAALNETRLALLFKLVLTTLSSGVDARKKSGVKQP